MPNSTDRILSLFTYLGRGGSGRLRRRPQGSPGPPGFGASTVFAVEHDEEVLRRSRASSGSVGFRGLLGVELVHAIRGLDPKGAGGEHAAARLGRRRDERARRPRAGCLRRPAVNRRSRSGLHRARLLGLLAKDAVTAARLAGRSGLDDLAGSSALPRAARAGGLRPRRPRARRGDRPLAGHARRREGPAEEAVIAEVRPAADAVVRSLSEPELASWRRDRGERRRRRDDRHWRMSRPGSELITLAGAAPRTAGTQARAGSRLPGRAPRGEGLRRGDRLALHPCPAPVADWGPTPPLEEPPATGSGRRCARSSSSSLTGPALLEEKGHDVIASSLARTGAGDVPSERPTSPARP